VEAAEVAAVEVAAAETSAVRKFAVVATAAEAEAAAAVAAGAATSEVARGWNVAPAKQLRTRRSAPRLPPTADRNPEAKRGAPLSKPTAAL
jgi:hypothetical protein